MTELEKLKKKNKSLKTMNIILLVFAVFLTIELFIFQSTLDDTKIEIEMLKNGSVTLVNNQTSVISETIIEPIKEIPAYFIGTFGFTYPIFGNPIVDILFITLIGAIILTLINKKFSDQTLLKYNKEATKKMQKKIKELLKSNPKKAQELQKEMMKKNFENMKQMFNMKVFIPSTIVGLGLFIFVKNNYEIFGEFLNLGFTNFAWLGTYILFFLIFSIALKKILKVY